MIPMLRVLAGLPSWNPRSSTSSSRAARSPSLDRLRLLLLRQQLHQRSQSQRGQGRALLQRAEKTGEALVDRPEAGKLGKSVGNRRVDIFTRKKLSNVRKLISPSEPHH